MKCTGTDPSLYAQGEMMNMRQVNILIVLFAISVILVTGPPLTANDGRDRYQSASVLSHLYAPISESAGFTVLEEDLEGGADGSPVFRWARPEVVAIITQLAHETFREKGSSSHPMAIFDLSAENGDTPLERGEDKLPSGRHPGNSHDGGINIDLGYFMTSLKGLHEDPDYAVCDNHFSATEKDKEGAPKDIYQCAGPVNRLDVERQAYFFLRLFQLHLHEFQEQLLVAVGVDHYVKEAVLNQIRLWKQENRYGIADDDIVAMDDMMTSDQWGGWARFHHHHTHIRFAELDESGTLRTVLRKTYAAERERDYSLFKKQFPQKNVFLKTDLSSYKLSRSLDVSLLTAPDQKITACSYRFDEGEWIVAAEPENNFRYVYDLPEGPVMKDSSITVTAQVTFMDGTSETTVRQVFLPAQSPYLRIEIDKAAFTTDYTRESQAGKEQWRLALSFPPLYRHYMTKVTYQVFFFDQNEAPLRVEGLGDDYGAIVIPAESQNVLYIEAHVSLSKRVTLSIPVFAAEL